VIPAGETAIHCESHVRFTPKAGIRVFIDLRSCPLALPEQAAAVPVMELSEPRQVSERVFSTLPV